MNIRKTNNSEINEIEKIHLAAFGEEKGPEVALLTLDLLNDKTAEPILSLAAIENDKMVGHVLFTKVTISCEQEVSAQILAPLAIHPDMQKKGVGKKLIKEGLKQLKESGVEIVFVLGHPDYYPRSGFIGKAEALGFIPPYSIPKKHEDAWMVLELKNGLIGKIKGNVTCSDVLSHPEHWRE